MKAEEKYDLIIIGGGPGGYTSAIKASKRGLKTALIEKDKVGGTCLHKGCIPTKALLQSAHLFYNAKNLETFGINAKDITIDLRKVQQRKSKIVEKLFKGVTGLLKKNKVDVYKGVGKIATDNSVTIMNDEKKISIIYAKKVIIATGSKPYLLPNINYDNKLILTSDNILNINEIPKSIIIVGAGAIGVEFASLFNALGSKVTLIESCDEILPYEDHEINRYLKRILKSKGIEILTSTFLENVTSENNSISAFFKNDKEKFELKASLILTALGRKPNLNKEEIKSLGIEFDGNFIKTNEYFETSRKGVFAIGDVKGPLLLAHSASSQGFLVIDYITGKKTDRFNTFNIPRVTYSFPETASIGFNERYFIEKGIEIKTAKFPFIANGKALINGEDSGFVKVISNKHSGKILGIHMIGAGVSELIGSTYSMIDMELSDLVASKFIFPHPSLAETIHESLLGLLGESIHI